MPFSFLNKFTRKFSGGRSYLGVDIGTTSIKIVETRNGKDKPKLVNYALFELRGHLERVNAALQTSALKLYDREVADYLKLIIRKAGFTSKQVVASVPAFSAFTTLINVPILSEEETTRTLQFRAKQYIPLPSDSITIDWVKVGEKTDKSGHRVQQIFLVAVPKSSVNQYQGIFRLAGLDLLALEVDGFSLARILTADKTKPILIIDIGSRSTSFLIAAGGLLKAISQSDFAGNSLTRRISSGLGINVRRAEDLKRQKGLVGFGHGPEQELSTLLMPLLDVIINEAKRAKSGYESGHGQEMSEVVLAGGGANLPGIGKYFKREMNLPVSKARPFAGVAYPAILEPLTGSLGPSLAAAIGLACKYQKK